MNGELDGCRSARHHHLPRHPAIGARGLYAGVVSALGGVPRFHKASLIPQASEALAAEEAERGKRVVIIVDEAHLLAADQLEELRLLTNAEMNSHSSFAQETAAYLSHHLKLVGRADTLFSDDAMVLVHQVCRGFRER